MIKKRVWELPEYDLPFSEGKVLIQTASGSYSLPVQDLATGGVTADLSYIHTQLSPSVEWVVDHNLGKFAAVTVVDSMGTRVFGDEEQVSTNRVILRFGAAMGGKAYLN